MKVRIEFEDGDDISQFSVIEYRTSVTLSDDESQSIAIEKFLTAMNYTTPEFLIARLIGYTYSLGDAKLMDAAMESEGLKIIETT